MTNKDTETIAAALAAVEEAYEHTFEQFGEKVWPTEYRRGHRDTLTDVRIELARAIAKAHPRFNAGAFEVAAQPRRSEELRRAIVAELQKETA